MAAARPGQKESHNERACFPTIPHGPQPPLANPAVRPMPTAGTIGATHAGSTKGGREARHQQLDRNKRSPMPLCFLPPKGTLLFSRLYWFTQTYMETASSQSRVNTRASEP